MGKHSNPIYLKTVDTNMENNLSLTDDQYTAQCENVTTDTPSCRAFDITVQAWDLMVVFASNQGSIAGEPAGLNGVVPVEYEEGLQRPCCRRSHPQFPLWSSRTVNYLIYISNLS